MENPEQPELTRTELFSALAAALMLVLAGYHVLIEATRSWDYNAIRLQRSYVLAAGQSIYPGQDTGAVLNAIYGPVGALAYLPVTVVRSPAAAVLTGQVLSLWIFFLPVLFLLRRRGRFGAVFGFLLFAALTLDLRPLEYVAFTIHVDPPALALAILAWSALIGAEPPHERRAWLIASLLAALAVWTKLMVLALFPALLFWIFLTGGFQRAARFLLYLAGVSALVSAGMILAFGPAEEMFFNLWTVPSRHTLTEITEPAEILRGMKRLLWENATAWVFWVVVLAARLRRRADWRREPAVSYGLLGLSLAPLSVFGLLKVGGDVNALSYAIYPLLLGAVLSWVEEARSSSFARRLSAALPAFVLAAVLAFQEPDVLESWRDPPAFSELPHQIAYEYARQHPGEIYFPRLTLSSLLAEGRVYHQSVGLLDRELAGFSLSPEHLRAHLPTRLRGIAFFENAFEKEIELIELPEFRHPVRDPDLPGFWVYQRRSAPAGAPDGGML